MRADERLADRGLVGELAVGRIGFRRANNGIRLFVIGLDVYKRQVPDRAEKVFFNQYLLSPSFFYRFQVSFYRS